jgi:lactoylglutathione lyase
MKFGYTGLRVQDLDGGVEFFTEVLGMKLKSKVDAPWNKGAFANLGYEGDEHYLELNWYSRESPMYVPFAEGEQLDHLGIKVDDLDAALKRLGDAGYPVLKGPFHEGGWHFAFVKGFEGVWLDVYKVDEKTG